jgi:CRISPR-associated protein Csx14
MSFRVEVDATNPGQFFACCGLFELTSRLDPATVAHFEESHFLVAGSPTLAGVLELLTTASLQQVEALDSTASPIHLGEPFELRLDWWKDTASGGRDLKTWAGTMQSGRITQAMVAALRDPALHRESLLDTGQIVYDPLDPTIKVEPFYFDSRRTPNSHSRDVGFSPNDLALTTTAFPAVEALCLVGLQRFRPSPVQRRVLDYRVWRTSLPVSIASAVVAGAVPLTSTDRYRFEVWYRTGQKKHKAFRAAARVAEGE